MLIYSIKFSASVFPFLSTESKKWAAENVHHLFHLSRFLKRILRHWTASPSILYSKCAVVRIIGRLVPTYNKGFPTAITRLPQHIFVKAGPAHSDQTISGFKANIVSRFVGYSKCVRYLVSCTET